MGELGNFQTKYINDKVNYPICIIQRIIKIYCKLVHIPENMVGKTDIEPFPKLHMCKFFGQVHFRCKSKKFVELIFAVDLHSV